MNKIPVSLAQDVANAFPKLVDLVRSKNLDAIHVRLEAFGGCEHLFYPTVWYITSHHKRVEVSSD